MGPRRSDTQGLALRRSHRGGSLLSCWSSLQRRSWKTLQRGNRSGCQELRPCGRGVVGRVDRPFYKVKPEARQMVVGDLTEARRARETLQCKNMTWYLEHVATEMLWESDKICIPGCSRAVEGNQCCEGPAASGRSAIDRLMPVHDYRPLVLSDVVARVYHQEL